MWFEQEVLGYLEGLSRARSADRRSVDEVALREHFLARLRGVESRAPREVERLFRTWSPRLTSLARYVARAPRVEPLDDDALARSVVDEALGVPADSVVDGLACAQLLSDFEVALGAGAYALETRLASPEPQGELGLTPLGRAFLKLRGKDAVRWLLTIESLSSQGRRDEWRAPRELFERLLAAGWLEADSSERGELAYEFASRTVLRLARLRVLERLTEDDAPFVRDGLNPAMRDVVQAVLEPGPWHTAVAAMLEDERAAALALPTGGAVAATHQQTKLIAHEVRNALVPVRHQLDALLRQATDDQRRRLEPSRRGVGRVLEFVDEMVATAELVRETATAVDVGALVREVASWHEGGERLELALGERPTPLRAPRIGLQRAISNLVLNALQATAAGELVRVSVRPLADAVEIAVDDGGPGVPPAEREAVFRDGYTTRPGGSGFGLAYARRIVEDELRGKLVCEPSELGGARFAMTLPADDEAPR